MSKEKIYKRAKRVVLTIVCVLLLLTLRYTPSGYLVIAPGPVVELANVIDVDGYPAVSTPSFFMVSVIAKDASVAEFVRATLDRDLAFWSKRAVLGQRSVEEYVGDNRNLMKNSQIIAVYVALASQGIPVSLDGPFPICTKIRPGQVAGPSAGLVFSLEIMSRMGHDMIMGRKIAGTGILESDGNVLSVGGIAQKTIACRNKGIEIFLVPKPNLSEALQYAGEMKVYGVDTFQEALHVLKN